MFLFWNLIHASTFGFLYSISNKAFLGSSQQGFATGRKPKEFEIVIHKESVAKPYATLERVTRKNMNTPTMVEIDAHDFIRLRNKDKCLTMSEENAVWKTCKNRINEQKFRWFPMELKSNPSKSKNKKPAAKEDSQGENETDDDEPSEKKSPPEDEKKLPGKKRPRKGKKKYKLSRGGAIKPAKNENRKPQAPHKPEQEECVINPANGQCYFILVDGNKITFLRFENENKRDLFTFE